MHAVGSVGNPAGKGPREGLIRRWVDNNIMDIKDIG
jgi:hypothetical protein